MTDRERYEELRLCCRGVVGCFNSRVNSSTCTEDHHPSCKAYMVSVLAKLDKDDDAHNSGAD